MSLVEVQEWRLPDTLPAIIGVTHICTCGHPRRNHCSETGACRDCVSHSSFDPCLGYEESWLLVDTEEEPV